MEKYRLNKKISELISKKMLGTISDEEMERLRDWINSSELNRIIYDEVVKSDKWTEFMSTYNTVDVNKAWDNVNSKTFSQRRLLHTFLKYAAVFLIPVALTLLFFYSNPVEEEKLVKEEVVVPGGSSAKLFLAGGKQISLGDKGYENIKELDGTLINSNSKELTYLNPDTIKVNSTIRNKIETPRGGEFIVTLSDGTVVHLNNLSHLEYPVQFGNKKREVVLKGEAFFKVAKDKKRPFIVKTNGVDIRVTGTKFNVRSYEDEHNIETVLVEGGVNVETQGENVMVRQLQPSHKATFSKNEHTIKIEEVNTLWATNWINGRFSFQDERLDDIMKVLSRWYNINVFYQNPEAKDMRFSGSLNKYESINPIIDIIKITNKVNVDIKGNNIVFRAK